ncbi:hypothetical protein [Amycolatopsis sp. WAC 01416]|uniref:hypothetical protein n=1 Tax=Amycolatopsis sp. WAC 01416 TaxID=2203196 RepID=UPI000F79BF12|nr:hypothetical protein [Amycolatopsis sp. WAC 01416]
MPVAAHEIVSRREDKSPELVEKLLATGNSLGLDDPDVLLKHIQHSIDRHIQVSASDLAIYAGDDLSRLATHADPKIRAALGRAWDYDMPEDIRRALLADPDPAVRESVAGYPHGDAPKDLHQRLLADEATRASVASYATLSREIAEELVATDNEELRAEVAKNPTLPTDLLDRLAEDPSGYVQAHVILRQDLPEDRRRELHRALCSAATGPWSAESFALTVLNANDVPWVRKLPLAERLAYLDSPIHCFRAAVAASPDLPPEVVAALHDDKDVGIRRLVARRPDTPGEVLERLVAQHGEHPKHRPLIVEHSNFPPEAFIRFASHSDPRRRSIALKGPDLPLEILAELATDPDGHVREGVAGHLKTPPEILRALIEDRDLGVCAAAGANPSLPRQVMLDLLGKAGL